MKKFIKILRGYNYWDFYPLKFRFVFLKDTFFVLEIFYLNLPNFNDNTDKYDIDGSLFSIKYVNHNRYYDLYRERYLHIELLFKKIILIDKNE